MAWENSIDRLILRQTHLAEKGEVKKPQVQTLVRDLLALDANRPESCFHSGYAKVLLGLDMPVPTDERSGPCMPP